MRQVSHSRRETTLMRKKTGIGSEYTVDYLLTETTLRPRRTFGKAYSVYAVLTDSLTGATETGYVFDFTRDRAFAVMLFGKIASGSVTPVTLLDVVSDAIAEYTC